MFTGIIEGVGTIQSIAKKKSSHRMTIKSPFSLTKVKPGESIAVNGVCLTVVSKKQKNFSVDVALESLRVTTLGDLKKGSHVNLERALRLSDRLGGHLVSGHVDACGTLKKIDLYKDSREWWIQIPARLKKYIIEKGSITLDGTSLTVNQVRGARFSVFLIPHTLKSTILKEKSTESRLNIEVDILGKYVESVLNGKSHPH
jgi:riboflavin synthase